MKTIFEWEGHVKPVMYFSGYFRKRCSIDFYKFFLKVSSIFIGLSPELELALYTICVLLKPDDACAISLGGKKVDIR